MCTNNYIMCFKLSYPSTRHVCKYAINLQTFEKFMGAVNKVQSFIHLRSVMFSTLFGHLL